MYIEGILKITIEESDIIPNEGDIIIDIKNNNMFEYDGCYLPKNYQLVDIFIVDNKGITLVTSEFINRDLIESIQYTYNKVDDDIQVYDGDKYLVEVEYNLNQKLEFWTRDLVLYKDSYYGSDTDCLKSRTISKKTLEKRKHIDNALGITKPKIGYKKDYKLNEEDISNISSSYVNIEQKIFADGMINAAFNTLNLIQEGKHNQDTDKEILIKLFNYLKTIYTK